MKCLFCHLDVDNPCSSAEQMQQRAADHVERCAHALLDMGANASRNRK